MSMVSSFLSFAGVILKLGGIAIVGVIIYSLFAGKAEERLLSRGCTLLWLAATVAAVIITWNSTDGDFVAVIVHALIPSAVSGFVGTILYTQNDHEGIGQYIGVAAGFGLSLLLMHFIGSLVGKIIVGALVIGVSYLFFKKPDKTDPMVDYLEDQSKSRTLEKFEIEELKRRTAGYYSIEREDAIKKYNQAHPDDKQ